MFASGSKNSFMYPTAVLTSLSPKSIPPVTFTINPFAPFTDVSRSGLSIAAIAASKALWSPSATPTPICAIPLSFIIVFISAKSIFINPGIVIKSVIP